MVYTMLDLANIIPDEILGINSDIKIKKEIREQEILISGKYKNGREFKLRLNRFINESLFYIGLGLFGGEGTKISTEEKKTWKGTPFEIANSNPEIIRKIMQLLNQLGIPKNIISPRLQIRITKKELEEGIVEKLIEFWSRNLQIPKEKFRKPSIRIKETPMRSPHGTITIRANPSILGQLFNYWMNLFLED